MNDISLIRLPRGGALVGAVIGFWTAIALVSISQAVLDSVAFDYTFRWQPAVIYVTRWYLWAAFVPLVAWVVSRLARLQGRALWTAHVAAALVVGALHFTAEILLLSVLWTALIEPLSPSHFLSKLVGLRLSVNVLVYALIAGAVGAYRLSERHEAARAEADRLRRDLDEVRSAALTGSLVPHAVFNTLQALNGLVVNGRSEDASVMIARLGAWLRALLDRRADPFSTVAEERVLADQYLDVQRVRFGDRLRVVWDVAPDVRRQLVPSWLLQPLVENAVVHAVAASAQPVTVSLSASAHDNGLRIVVRDDGPGDRAAAGEAGGVGLDLVRRRLLSLYGDGAALQTSYPLAGGFEAVVTLPFRTAPKVVQRLGETTRTRLQERQL